MDREISSPNGRIEVMTMSSVLFVSTHFDDNMEIATMPWAVGNAALAEEKEVAIFLQGLAVRQAKKGETKGLRFPPFPSLDTLRESFLEAGGKIYVCAPCMNAHAIEKSELIEEAEVAGAAFLMQLAEGSIVFTY